MSSRSVPPSLRSSGGRRRRLLTATLVAGLAGALTLGQAGVATAAPEATGAVHGWTLSTTRARVVRSVRVVHSPAATKRPEALVRYGHWAFPSVTRLADGSLRVVYREGANHYSRRDGFIRSTTSTDLGRTWSKPVTVIPTAPGIDYRDPSISTSRDGGTLYLTYFKGLSSLSAAGSFFRSSTDGGATWSGEVRIDPNLASSAITAPVVQLADGSLAAVHYSRAAGESRDSVWWSRSTDRGATWTTTRLINGQSAGRDYQEPYLVSQGANLFLTFRWGNRDSIGSMTSSNSGYTWSTPAPDFPGTGRPSSVWLADGTLVVYVRDPAGDFDIRVSADRGATWGPARLIQTPPRGGMSTYASFVEVTPGSVFTVMTAEDASAIRSGLSFTTLSDWAALASRPAAATAIPVW